MNHHITHYKNTLAINFFWLVGFLILVSHSLLGWAADVHVEVLDKHGKPLEGALVSLHGANIPSPEPMTLDLVQRELIFEPQVSVVTSGSTVKFVNQDDIKHHVYSFSKAWKKQFHLQRNEMVEYVLDKPGQVVLGCNVHDWMLGYIYVLDTPFFGQTNKAGKLMLSGAPAGKFKLHVQHPRLRDGRGLIKQDVRVNEDFALPLVSIRLKKSLLPQRNQIPDLEDY